MVYGIGPGIGIVGRVDVDHSGCASASQACYPKCHLQMGFKASGQQGWRIVLRFKLKYSISSSEDCRYLLHAYVSVKEAFQ